MIFPADYFNTFEFCEKSNAVKISSLESVIFFLLDDESAYFYTGESRVHFLAENIINIGLGWFLNNQNELLYFCDNSLMKIEHVNGIEISDFSIIDITPNDKFNVAIWFE